MKFKKNEIIFDIFQVLDTQMLIAMKNKAVVCILFETNTENLINQLYKYYSRAIKKPDINILKVYNEVINYLNSPKSTNLNLITIDMSGTLFQKEVWNELKLIPVGKTRSYTDIAIKLNKPKSFRSVANACAANKIAILIPCHRVINKNGKLSNYRWSIQMKQKLLNLEKEFHSKSDV